MCLPWLRGALWVDLQPCCWHEALWGSRREPFGALIQIGPCEFHRNAQDVRCMGLRGVRRSGKELPRFGARCHVQVRKGVSNVFLAKIVRPIYHASWTARVGAHECELPPIHQPEVSSTILFLLYIGSGKLGMKHRHI